MSTLDVTREMTSSKTHPWISFRLDLRQAPYGLWMMLGECQSKCEHLAGVPLAPEIDSYLHRVYLAKGAAATAAIEGNTLSEQQVLQAIEGKLALPPSQEYLKQEIDNILAGCNLVLGEINSGIVPPITVARLKELNRLILNNLKLADPEAVPGEIRHHTVGVGRYRGAPWQECEYLLEKLCEWLNGGDFRNNDVDSMMLGILKAAIAHLYIAWIHPFGDGNGRTARLIEVQILLSSGVPAPAAQLLSNHYNVTRTEYYRYLDSAQRDPLSFVTYAVQGFRDGLREHIEVVRFEQWEIAWVNYVHKRFDGLKGMPHDRRKHLMLDLSLQEKPVPFAKLKEISPRVAVHYKDRTYRTLLRDVKSLLAMDLISFDKKSGGWRSKKEAILAFLPIRTKTKAS